MYELECEFVYSKMFRYMRTCTQCDYRINEKLGMNDFI